MLVPVLVPERLRVHIRKGDSSRYSYKYWRAPGSGPDVGGSWHRASQFVGVHQSSKMKRRHAGAIGRPGGSGAAPRARQRYAICNDGDTQGTLKSASLEPFCFVVQQTEARMGERMKERREQRHKQTNSGSMSVQSRTGVGWGVCSS